MRELLTASFLLFRIQLASLARSKRTLVCAALAALPPMFALLVIHFGPDRSPSTAVSFIAWSLSLQVIVPIVALVAGSSVVTEELENRTITYLFTRPIPRASLLLGRWLAAFVVAGVLLGASAVGVVLAAADGDPLGALASPRARGLLTASIAGGAAYSMLFAVAGVFVRRSMILGLAYAFAVEGLVANLPGEMQSLSLQYQLRGLFVRPGMDELERLSTWGLDQLPGIGAAAQNLAIAFLVALAIGCWGIRRRQYLVSA